MIPINKLFFKISRFEKQQQNQLNFKISINQHMRITLLFLLVLFSSSPMTSQIADAELFFKDGTSLKGFGMIDKKDNIKIRLSLEDEPNVWTSLMVKKIIFYGFETQEEFQYVVLKPDTEAILLKVLVDEEIKLFADWERTPQYPFKKQHQTFLKNASKPEIVSTKLYIQKVTEDFPFPLTGNFKRKAKDYFSDCVGIIKKLNSGEFRKSTATDMVYYYSDICMD